MARRAGTVLRAPFLKRVSFNDRDAPADQYPFTIPLIRDKTLELELTKPVTIVVGENGTGKSTLLEAIASQAGFNVMGGSADNRYGGEAAPVLARHLRLSWLPKVSRGFFMRAESFFYFASYIDEIGGNLDAYGGESLHRRSHGEAFLALFENRFGPDGFYILDEPEAALSPSRQLVFLRVLKELEEQNCQVLIATHSPILMAYPGADLLMIADDGSFVRTGFRRTSHYLLLREFMKDPEGFVGGMLRDDEAS